MHSGRAGAQHLPRCTKFYSVIYGRPSKGVRQKTFYLLWRPYYFFYFYLQNAVFQLVAAAAAAGKILIFVA